MPTTASYQTPNSYQELDFKPYALDYSSVLKEASAKTSYWMEGAAKIQQAYSKITGLAPQFIKNKEALNQFNNQVKDKIKKLAGTDLAIQGNANMINDVIAPLYDTSNEVNEAILLDDSYNKAGQNLLKTIEGYKTKDKGVGYSPNNEKYATEWYQAYMKKAQDPNASLNDLRALRDQVKQYTPYYDYNKELEFAITKCPENSSSQDSIKGDYNVNVSSTTKNVGPCIESFLSDKAKSQMQIDGYVQYGRNYSALGNDVMRMNKPTVDNYSKELGLIALKLQDSKITPEEKEAYTQYKASIQSELDKVNTLTAKIAIGDYSDIEKNYEQYAGMAHINSKISSLGKSYSSVKDNTEIHGDEVRLMYKKLQVEMAESEKQRQFEAQQNKFKEQKADERFYAKEANDNIRAGLTAAGKPVQPLPELVSYETADGSTDIVMDKTKFLQQGKTIIENTWDAELALSNYVFSKYGRNSKVNIKNKKEAETYIRGLIATDPRVQQDPTVQEMTNEIENRRLYYNLWNVENKRIEQKIAKDLKDSQQPLTVETINGNKYIVRPENFNKNLNFTFSQAGITGWVNITDSKGNIIKKEPIKYANNVYDKTKVATNIENDLYKTAVTPSQLWVSNENRNIKPKEKPDLIRQRLSTVLSGLTSDEDGKKRLEYDDIKIGRNNLNGDVEIILPMMSVNTVDKVNAAKKALRAEFKSEDPINMGNGKFKLKGVAEFKDPSANDAYLETIIQRMMTSINETNFDPQEEIPILTNYKNRFEIYTKKATPGVIFMYDKTIPNSTIVTTTNISELVSQLKQAR
jgi:hypothetical protein